MRVGDLCFPLWLLLCLANRAPLHFLISSSYMGGANFWGTSRDDVSSHTFGEIDR